MSAVLGMDPERVSGHLHRARAQLGRLDEVSEVVNEAAWLSLNPMTYGVQPGGLLLAPLSIAGTQRAAALVRSARAEAERLIEGALGDVAEQRRTSEQLDNSVQDVSSTRPRSYGELPAWITAAWGLPRALDVLSGATEGIRRMSESRFWVFARRQWVNRGVGFNRFRLGALQFGSSTYKNNPVAFVRRSIPPIPVKPGVLTWAGRVGKVAGAAGLALTAWSAWDEKWNDTGHLEDGERHVRAGSHAAATTAGAAAGAWAGAKAGALVGAAIGSIFPGPGTVIGGVVGGIVGGIVGGMAGAEIGGGADDFLWGLFS